MSGLGRCGLAVLACVCIWLCSLVAAPLLLPPPVASASTICPAGAVDDCVFTSLSPGSYTGDSPSFDTLGSWSDVEVGGSSSLTVVTDTALEADGRQIVGGASGCNDNYIYQPSCYVVTQARMIYGSWYIVASLCSGGASFQLVNAGVVSIANTLDCLGGTPDYFQWLGNTGVYDLLLSVSQASSVSEFSISPAGMPDDPVTTAMYDTLVHSEPGMIQVIGDWLPFVFGGAAGMTFLSFVVSAFGRIMAGRGL